jgi:hypothetical protein
MGFLGLEVTSLQTVWRIGEAGEEDSDELMAKITTQVTRWICLPLLDYGTELVHVRSWPSQSECIRIK